MKKWLCEICGYPYEGDNPPDACPKCKGPKEKFSIEQMNQPNVSIFTKNIHGIMNLETLMTKVIDVAERGIQDKLDPTCVSIFTKAKAEATVIKQMAQAEIKSHISKGNWG